MKHTAYGFTVIELLLTIATISILAVFLVPEMLASRARATDGAANAVANRVLHAMMAAENLNDTSSGQDATCDLQNGIVIVSSGNISNKISAVGPVTAIACSSTSIEYRVTVTYVGGRSGYSPYTLTALKR